jgi:acid phosphatase (class A)
MDILMMTQNSHPKTFFVMKVAARVGEVVMMHLKRKFNRTRPSQMFPLLSPPIEVPGHSAYPAGHALIAQLTAKVLIEATTKGTKSPYDEALKALAAEIGFNRVVAGFHFRSDITAGEFAGDLTHQFLKGMPPTYTSSNPPRPHDFDYATAIAAAQAEW